jgi:hypothetical protein|tara:strand:+ start:314 stop:496 length:183 start_codon:yes stop_codon:yes gene_type:complete
MEILRKIIGLSKKKKEVKPKKLEVSNMNDLDSAIEVNTEIKSENKSETKSETKSSLTFGN